MKPGDTEPRPLYLTAEQHQAKVVERANARANLAALVCSRHGIDVSGPVGRHDIAAAAAEFAELSAMLGLEAAPDREPGTCRRCGGSMALNRQIRRDKRTNGLCETCDQGNTIACRRDGT
jgi:hypothetical protein